MRTKAVPGLLWDLAVVAHFAPYAWPSAGVVSLGEPPSQCGSLCREASAFKMMRLCSVSTAAFFDRPASNRALALVRRRARCEQLLPPRNRTSAKAPEVEPPPQAMRRRAYLFGGVE
jgi:hypothetical protein